jgi:hypothetical protein
VINVRFGLRKTFSSRFNFLRFHTARVKSVAIFNRQPRLDFRYTPLATELARRCKMSRWARTTPQHTAQLLDHLVGAGGT